MAKSIYQLQQESESNSYFSSLDNNINNDYNIESYPTIYIVKNNNIKFYVGDRSFDDFKNKLN